MIDEFIYTKSYNWINGDPKPLDDHILNERLFIYLSINLSMKFFRLTMRWAIGLTAYMYSANS